MENPNQPMSVKQNAATPSTPENMIEKSTLKHKYFKLGIPTIVIIIFSFIVFFSAIILIVMPIYKTGNRSENRNIHTINPTPQFTYTPSPKEINPDTSTLPYRYISETEIALEPFIGGRALDKFAFKPDGTEVASINNGNLIINGKVINKNYGKYDFPIYNQDGRKFGFMGMKNNKWYFVVDSKENAPYDWASFPKFSGDGMHYIYAAIKNNKWLIIKDNQEFDAYGYDIYKTYINYDGTKFAYVGKEKIDEKKEFVVFNNKKYKSFDAIQGLVISPDGKHFVYGAYNERPLPLGGTDDHFFFDGIEKKREEMGCLSPTSNYVFSNDSKQFAFRCGNYMILNGKSLPGNFSEINDPFFSPDNKHLIFTTTELVNLGTYGAEYWGNIVIDGKVFYKKLLGWPRIYHVNFSPDGKSIIIILYKDNTWIKVALSSIQ